MMDNYDAWFAHDMEVERWRQSRPVCVTCGEHIQDEKLYQTDKGSMCYECASALAEKYASEVYNIFMDGWETDNE